eukprot:CAMPEP_0170591704 /NCGR_PEP_ID=MMETSP0224-20130122/12540_1 /TAXON_ID=285029 /ORGANISM="Togula jolla, Strain CCCM 725" /LENGTH=235 /DNA_ID=CAMNT_0010915575 /DNA_START=3 /DNA_END=710 /DNA_ORIENTATION=+
MKRQTLMNLAALAWLGHAADIIGYDGQEHQYKSHHRGHRGSPKLRQLPHRVHMLNSPLQAARAEECTRRGFKSDDLIACTKFMERFCMEDAAMLRTPGCSSFFAAHAANTSKAENATEPAEAEAPKAPEAQGAAPAPAAAPSPPELEDEPRQEQGFQGPPVEHDDGKSVTADWHQEYGPHAKHLQSYKKICAKYPDNEWCRLHGHHVHKVKSGASSTASSCLLMLLPGLLVPMWL